MWIRKGANWVWGSCVLEDRRKWAQPVRPVLSRRKFVAALAMSVAVLVGPVDKTHAWIGFSHGGGGAPVLPVWLSPGPGTNYYVDDTGGNDGNTGLSIAQAWRTTGKVAGFSFSGTTTVNWKGGGSFTFSSGGTLSPVANQTYQAPVVNRATLPANAAGHHLINVVAVNVSLLGLSILGDNVGRTPTFTENGVSINNVAGTTISGCLIQNFWGDGTTTVGASIVLQGAVNGTKIGGVLSSDARFGGAPDNILGGINGPTSLDDNGILAAFCVLNELGGGNNPVTIKGNLMRDIGGGGFGAQSGFGMNMVFRGASSNLPLTYDPTSGEPTNALAESSGNVIMRCAANAKTCGGSMAIEWGRSDRFWDHDNAEYLIGGICVFQGSITGNTLTVLGPVSGLPLGTGSFATFNSSTPLVVGLGVAAGTVITGGSGTTWTIAGSPQTVTSTKITVTYQDGGTTCDNGGSDVDGNCTNWCRERNYAQDCWGPGILDFFSSGQGPGIERYHLSVNCGYVGTNEGAFAIQGKGSTSVNIVAIYNCTTIAPRGATPFLTFGAFAPQDASGISGFCVNCIFINDTNAFMVGANSVPFTFLLSHNNYGGIGSTGYNTYVMGGTQYTSFAAWVAGMQGADQNGLNVDPLFTNPYGTETIADWTLSTSSPLLGVGVDITSSPYNQVPAKDFYGVSPGGQHNRGCYAYGPGV